MALRDTSSEHRPYAGKYGDETPEFAGWRRDQGQWGGAQATSTEREGL